VLLIPLGAMIGLARSEAEGLALFIAITFLTPVAYGTGTAALQAVTPGHMQGVMTGLFTFITNAAGMGLGPTTVALSGSMVGAAPSSIAGGIAFAMVLLLPLAIVLQLLVINPYRARVEGAIAAAIEHGRAPPSN
jgi:hypothetical protein